MAEDQKHAWPIPGQRLMQPSGEGDARMLNACFFTDRDFNIYASGYRSAAERLFEYVFEHDRNIDTLIYPFVFCWRHFLELRLKKIIADGRYMAEKGEGFPQHHHLDHLWREARTYLEEIEQSVPEYGAIDDVVKELALADPDSFHYRYPTHKDGSATMPPGTKNLNWGQFHSVMLGVANFFEAVQCELDQRVSYKLEMEAEARRNCE
jgi:hypothetical protein